MIQNSLLTIISIAALAVATASTAEEGFWSKASRDFSNATDTASDTAVDTSKDAWNTTKEVSGDAWDATKGAVHDGAEYVEEKTAD